MDNQRDLQNTVKFYQRHIFVDTGARPWHARVEDSDETVARLMQALDRSPALMPTTRVTAYRERKLLSGRDFLVFPDAVRYTATVEQPEDRIIRQLSGHDLEVPLTSSRLDGTHFFVCVHAERDERCGRCGPPIMEALEDYLSDQNVLSNWYVYPCSHVGGHRYAGNLLVYPGGYWYGYVTPASVSMIVDHIVQDRIFHPLFRGQMAPRS